LIIKNIFKIHFLYYVFAFICFLTGQFKNFIIFSSIIIIHEFGHLSGAIIFKWNIKNVILLPFGGITIFEEQIDKPLLQEFIITILGPIFQIVFLVTFKGNIYFYYCNIAILLFNLLPIYPLDGSKLLNIFFNTIVPFKYSHVLTLLFSIVTIFFVIYISIFTYNFVFFLFAFFLVVEVIKEISKHNLYFNKFLLERYLYDSRYKKRKIIRKIEEMKKQTTHIFKIDNRYYTEKEIVAKRFDK